MGTKSTVKEKAKAYLESLSEKQKRGILIAMLVFTCVASGIVLLRAAGPAETGKGAHGASLPGKAASRIPCADCPIP